MSQRQCPLRGALSFELRPQFCYKVRPEVSPCSPRKLSFLFCRMGLVKSASRVAERAKQATRVTCQSPCSAEAFSPLSSELEGNSCSLRAEPGAAERFPEAFALWPHHEQDALSSVHCEPQRAALHCHMPPSIKCPV